jgi:hypothetical protein
VRGLWIAIGLVGCSFQPGRFTARDDGGATGDVASDGDPDDALDPDAWPAARKKAITIDGSKVPEALTDFPVWVELDDADIAASATPGGADIFFTNVTGQPVPFEIQRWNPAGHLEAWVKLDLSAAIPTVFYVRYGEPTGAPAESPAQVFSSSFAAVWHLEDELSTATVVDATGTHAGTATGGLGVSDQVAGQLGGSIDFDGAANAIGFTNPLLGSGPHTMSAWVSARTPTSTYDSIITVGNNAMRQSRWLFSNNFMSNLAVGLFGDDINTGDNVIGDGWILVAWTYSAGVSRVFKNGVQLGNDVTHAGTANTTGTVGNIGWAPMQWGSGGTTPAGLNGILDEVRIAIVARSAGWLATEYANQTHSPQSPFYTVGAEQPVP